MGQSGIDSTTLAIIVTFSSSLVLVITVLVLVFDIRIAAKDAYLVERLKEKNEELQQRAEELAEDITRQIQSTAERDRFLAAIVEQSGTAIIVTDEEGKIQQWNSGAPRLSTALVSCYC